MWLKFRLWLLEHELTIANSTGRNPVSVADIRRRIQRLRAKIKATTDKSRLEKM